MLNVKPTAAVHTYDPPNDPHEAATLRASFEHEASDPSMTTPPASPPPSEWDSDSSEENSMHVPPPSPPIFHTNRQNSRRQHPHAGPSAVSINFAPNVAVNMDLGTVYILTPCICIS